ncbi:uncharacterized protein LOC142341065 isoform X2 [Convolutriloba macropyga]
MSSSLGNSANSSSFEVFNRSASTSSINRDVPSESGGADSAHGNGSNLHLSCWSRCSFTHQGLLKLRRDILLTTANELKISLDEAEILLSSSFWAKDIAASNHADMKDRLSVRSRKESASTNSSYHTPTITGVSTSRSQSHTTNVATTHFFSLNESPSSYSSLSDPGSRTKSRTDSNVSGTVQIVAAEVHNNNGTTVSDNFLNGDTCSFDQTVVIDSLLESTADNTSAVFRGSFEPDCEICMLPVDLSEHCNNVIQLTCNHCVCYSCWVDYTKMQVSKDRKCTIECPVYECDQVVSSLKVEKLIRSFIEFDASRDKVEVVTSEVSRLVGLLDENRIERFVEVLESVRWCPMPDCSLAVKLPKFLSKRPCVNYFYSLKTEPTSAPIDSGTNNATDVLRLQSSLGSMNVVPQSHPNVSAHLASRRAARNAARARSGKREVNKTEKEPELQVIPEDQISSVSVLCANEHYFCWNCRNEGHQPASCDHWNSWFQKIEEVKPNQMGTKDIWESAEYAANYLWFVTQSKKCPKCTAPIQKVDGCNHMKCLAKGCRHEFCWVCLTPWSKHGSATGGFWRCNRFTNSAGIIGEQQVVQSQSTNTSTSNDNGQNTGSTPQENNSEQPLASSERVGEPHTSSTVAQNKTSSRISIVGTKANPVHNSRQGLSKLNDRESSSTTNTQSANGIGRIAKQNRSLTTSVSGVRENNRAPESTVSQNQNNPARRSTEATNNPNQSAAINRSGREAAARLNDLHRFLHYYARFFNHRLSMKLELPLLEQARERISSLLRCFECSGSSQHVAQLEDNRGTTSNFDVAKKQKNSDNGNHINGDTSGKEEDDEESIERQKRLTFLETAIKELILTRKVLSASYVFAYYLSDSHHQNVRSLFEFIQNDLEETVENLAQIVNKQHLSAPWFLVEKAQLIVKKKRYELLDATTRGILPSDTSPIFKRKRKTFQGVQVCLDPLKMNMSERQAVMTSLYEMVVEGDGWLVDSTGCHNNIPMLYGHEDYYDLDINGGPLVHSGLTTVTSGGVARQSGATSANKVINNQVGKNKKAWPTGNSTDSDAAKQCARKGCNRRVSLPAKLTNKRKNGVIGGWLSRQKLSDPTHQLPYRNLYDNKQNITNSFCSLSCMRRDKLDSLENSGFTVTGQKSSNVNLSSTSVQMSLDSEFPPVFLDNEKIDRKRREIVKMNYQQQELENQQETEDVTRKVPEDSDSLSSMLNNEISMSVKVTLPQNEDETVFDVERVKINETTQFNTLSLDNGRILHQCSSSAA